MSGYRGFPYSKDVSNPTIPFLIRKWGSDSFLRMLNKVPQSVRTKAATIVLLFTAAQGVWAATKDADTRPPYAMFEGMDLQVTTEEGVFPVVGFTKKQIIVARNGNKDSLSAKSSISYALRNKLTEKWVDLEILETELFYSKMNSDFSAYSATLSQLDREQDRSADYSIGTRSGFIESDLPFGRGWKFEAL